MSAPLATVVVGCGHIGVSQHLPTLARDPRFRVTAVADPAPGRAEAVARRFSVPRALLDPDEALASGPDAVVLATPPHVTADLAARALDAGIHVLCEKPVAVSLDAADRLVEAAERSGCVLQVGFKNRFSPLVLALRDRVLDGTLGAPLVARIGSFDERYDPADAVHTERIHSFLEHGPPVVHEGAHSADLLGWLLGRPVRVSAAAARTRPLLPAPNYHCAAIEYADGSLAKLEVGWWFPQVYPGELQLYGPDGAADLSREQGRLLVDDGRRTEVVRFEDDWQTVCFRGQYDAFAEAIATGVRRGPDATAGRDALELTLAVVEAAESGAPVQLGAAAG